MNNQNWQVSESESGLRLDKWLAAAERLGSRSKALSAIERGKVFVNDVEQTVTGAARRLQTGEIVRLWMDRPGSAERRYTERREAGLHLLYEDSSLLVINKPAGLLTVPLPSQPDEPSLLDQVKHHLRSHKKLDPLLVHRIDRDTSGIVIFAKTPEAQRKLKDQFEQRSAERVYLAVVYGHPKPESGTWRDFLVWNQDSLKQQLAERRDRNAKEAVSRYRMLETFPGAALIEVSLVTGKRNQIRVQAALRGHPLVGEKKYVYDPTPQPRIAFTRQALHAHRLAFKHPMNQRLMNFEALPPDDFQSLVETLRKRKRAGAL
ncbi:MAG: RluA family pseudouridine synthase [Acidobacteria bacterium]|nr:RluA family pseudouridine synthase [Acidobacteriota bacterium]